MLTASGAIDFRAQLASYAASSTVTCLGHLSTTRDMPRCIEEAGGTATMLALLGFNLAVQTSATVMLKAWRS